MGLRFRKSIKLGGGARLNLSKSGVGFSVGTKGARVTKKANGGSRSTVSIPGTGISYVKDSKQGSNRRNESKMKRADTGMNNNGNPKKKTWLWILGWLFIFPLPLTIILLRKKEMKALLKYGIIAAAWIVYLIIAVAAGSGSSDTNNSTAAEKTDDAAGNIKAIVLEKPDDVTLKMGETYSSYSDFAEIDVNKKKNFSLEDVIFESSDPDVVSISFIKDSMTTKLYYEVTTKGAGEAYVYCKSSDGSIVSNKKKIIVLDPVLVESISLEASKEGELVLGDSLSLTATVAPDNAEDTSITWESSDPNVAVVGEKGGVMAVGGGTATITATATNGVSASYEVTVDGTRRLMSLRITKKRVDDINIGDEWSHSTDINGENVVGGSYPVAVGDNLNCHIRSTEEDDNPDIGEASASHTVSEEDVLNGFNVDMSVYVTENGGKNSGQTAQFDVSFIFSPE